MTTRVALDVRPLSPNIGAEIHGLDLANGQSTLQIMDVSKTES